MYCQGSQKCAAIYHIQLIIKMMMGPEAQTIKGTSPTGLTKHQNHQRTGK